MIEPLVAAAERRSDALALVDARCRWTWRELLADAKDLAGRLGATPGDRIALLSLDTGAAVMAIHAVRLAGATLVPLNRRLTLAELVPLLTRSGTTQLIHDQHHAAVAAEIGAAIARLTLVPLGTPGPVAAPAEVGPLDLGAMGAVMFTSGTTGAPRGARLTHANLLSSAQSWNTFLDASGDDHWLAALPLSHVAGLGVVLRSTCSGALLTVHDRFDPAAVRSALANDGVTHVSLVPTQLARLLDDGPVVAPHLRALLLGGALIAPALVQRAVAAGLPIVTTYGLTEAASGVTALPASETGAHPASSGRALPGMRVRVMADDGTDCAPQTVGGIAVSGPTIFAGYSGDPAATASALHDGWLRTGDLGRLDDDGRLTIIDRRDDLIVSGGENISPVEVETLLMSHPDIADAAVVGRPDPTWGAVPVAAVVLRAGVLDIDTGAVRAFCRARLAGYKIPVAIELVPAIPRTASGKIIRRDVRRLLDSAAADLFVDRPDGARIHVRRRGHGPVLVLLHATLSNALELDPLAAALAERWTVLAIDRRSAGASVMPPDDVLGPVDAAVHVADIVAVLDAVAPDERPLVVGHSYGGCVALELAGRHPERVSVAWVFEPPYLAVVPDTAADSVALGQRITAIAREAGLGPAALAFLETVNGPGIVRRLPPTVLQQFEREGRGAVADSALAGFQPALLGDIRAPVVIGLGGRSRGPYESVAAGLAERIAILDIERFPSLGHGGPISQSGVIAEAILMRAERHSDLVPPHVALLDPTTGGFS